MAWVSEPPKRARLSPRGPPTVSRRIPLVVVSSSTASAFAHHPRRHHHLFATSDPSPPSPAHHLPSASSSFTLHSLLLVDTAPRQETSILRSLSARSQPSSFLVFFSDTGSLQRQPFARVCGQGAAQSSSLDVTHTLQPPSCESSLRPCFSSHWVYQLLPR